MEYVSLGGDCSVAYNLQTLNKRTFAYPFDWVRINSLNIISDIIENEFNDFISSATKIDESNKFPLIDDNFSDNKNNTLIMENKYGVRFYHDFSANYNLNEIIEKYNRRIKRFSKLIKSNRNICFIRYEFKNNIVESDIIRFIDIIKQINPNIQFKMILIIHNPKNNKLCISLNENIENVIVVNDVRKFDSWKRENINWNNIIK